MRLPPLVWTLVSTRGTVVHSAAIVLLRSRPQLSVHRVRNQEYKVYIRPFRSSNSTEFAADVLLLVPHSNLGRVLLELVVYISRSTRATERTPVCSIVVLILVPLT